MLLSLRDSWLLPGGIGIMRESFSAGFGGSRSGATQTDAETDGLESCLPGTADEQRRRLPDAGPQGSGQPAKRLGAALRAAQERDEAGGTTPVRVQHLTPVHLDCPVLPRDEIDMDDVDSRAEDHVGDETRYRLLTKEHAAVARQISDDKGLPFGWRRRFRSRSLTSLSLRNTRLLPGRRCRD